MPILCKLGNSRWVWVDHAPGLVKSTITQILKKAEKIKIPGNKLLVAYYVLIRHNM